MLHGSVGRDFKKAYRRNTDGSNSPRMYRFETDALGRCEYVMFTIKQYAAADNYYNQDNWIDETPESEGGRA